MMVQARMIWRSVKVWATPGPRYIQVLISTQQSGRTVPGLAIAQSTMSAYTSRQSCTSLCISQQMATPAPPVALHHLAAFGAECTMQGRQMNLEPHKRQHSNMGRMQSVDSTSAPPEQIPSNASRTDIKRFINRRRAYAPCPARFGNSAASLIEGFPHTCGCGWQRNCMSARAASPHQL